MSAEPKQPRVESKSSNDALPRHARVGCLGPMHQPPIPVHQIIDCRRFAPMSTYVAAANNHLCGTVVPDLRPLQAAGNTSTLQVVLQLCERHCSEDQMRQRASQRVSE